MRYKKPSFLEVRDPIPRAVLIERFVREAQLKIANNEPLGLGDYSHTVITEALHQVVYTPEEEAELGLVYASGSRTSNLPVHCLWPHNEPIDRTTVLSIGTLSYRHKEYEDGTFADVDRYLILDRETRALSDLEIDLLAYERMSEQLKDPFFSRNTAYIEIYQSGLEPLVVGMYRAVVSHLQERNRLGLPKMWIQPVYYVGERGRDEGSIWR